MFSVPGWSITAPLKTQTEPVKIPALPTIRATKSNEEASKKRKRNQGDAEDLKSKKLKPEKRTDKDGKSDISSERINETTGPTGVKAEKKKKKKEKGKEKAALKGKILTQDPDRDIPEKADISKAKEKNNRQSEKEDVKVGAEERLDQAHSSEKRDKKARRKEKKAKEAAMGKEHSAGADNRQEVTQSSKSLSANTTNDPKLTATSTATPALTPLQASMQSKLASARFRYLNEKLYTTASTEALEMFKNEPKTFEEYHSGFRRQVEVWPENPVDGYISDIKRRGAVKSGQKGSNKDGRPLPRSQGVCTIADLGCGDAKLATELQKSQDKLNIKILSYDLHSQSPLVTRADIAHLPLPNGSVNVSIFCLALMGTNWPDFIDEAYRVLHWKGELWVAEIKSRFGHVGKKSGAGKVVDHSVGNKKKKPRSRMSEAEKRREDEVRKHEDETLAAEVDGVKVEADDDDETDVRAFVHVLASRGFVLDEEFQVDKSNKMFVKMRFLKAAQPTKGKNVSKGAEGSTWKPKGKKFLETGGEVDEAKVLKPCVYKLR
ncbi:uncharacterized protein PV09_03144 [Verruconis gallopava]|uniref:Ribosomal RNA-processing protein 8 n=1 Tax=Verruconis gallopava TaxID=253628 RepID=A0A0D2B422_9PEZI|nr:uncharacterized protein PV09_03144 [Verruconis gallopava]KIW05959.1 hypothetical protein PV09_03144 [Verruconis gallopava]